MSYFAAYLLVCTVRVVRPDSLAYKSEVTAVPHVSVADKRSSSARPASLTRDTSPVMLRHKEASASVSSADSASSLTKALSV